MTANRARGALRRMGITGSETSIPTRAIHAVEDRAARRVMRLEERAPELRPHNERASTRKPGVTGSAKSLDQVQAMGVA